MAKPYASGVLDLTRRALLEGCGRSALEDFGFEVKQTSAVGIRPGGRLKISKDGSPSTTVRVRTSKNRHVSFAQDPVTRQWRSLSNCSQVIVSAVSYDSPQFAEVLAFEQSLLAKVLDNAKAQQQLQSGTGDENGLLVMSLDPKDDEADLSANLVAHSTWRVMVPLAKVKKRLAGTEQFGANSAMGKIKLPLAELIAELRIEYAKVLGSDPSKVVISFDHLP